MDTMKKKRLLSMTNMFRRTRLAFVGLLAAAALGASPAAAEVGISVGSQTACPPNCTTVERERELDGLVELGTPWIRTDFEWNVIQPTKATLDWSRYDALVAAANARGQKIIATLDYTPAWANGGHSDHNYEPASANQFAEFARKVVVRYKAKGLHTYEIWNEPNIGFWKPKPNPGKYEALLAATYEKIHLKDPAATIITGGSSPAGNGSESFSPQTWLKELYTAGAKPFFNAVGHHPYVDGSSTPGDLGNAWKLMSSEYPPENLRGIMEANGDGAKKIWATEVGCRRSSQGCESGERLTQALTKWHGYSWAGVLAWFTYWDPNEYGLVDGSWNHRPSWTALREAPK